MNTFQNVAMKVQLHRYVDDVDWTTNIGFEVAIFNLYEIEQNSRIFCVNLALHF